MSTLTFSDLLTSPLRFQLEIRKVWKQMNVKNFTQK